MYKDSSVLINQIYFFHNSCKKVNSCIREIDTGNIMDNAAEAIKEVLLELNRPATSKEIKKLVSEKYPDKFEDSTIVAHVYGCSANNPKAYEHHSSQPKILWDRQDGTYELYDPKKHGEVFEGYPTIAPKNPKEPIINDEQPFIVINNEKYSLSCPEDEAQLEEMVKEHSKLIFGDDSLYFDIKKQITTKTDVGSKPDGYAISLNSKQWYVVEVELASHDPYKHVLPQVTKFLNGIDNHDNQKTIINWISARFNRTLMRKRSWTE